RVVAMISNRFAVSSGMTSSRPSCSATYYQGTRRPGRNLGMCNDFGNHTPYSDYLAAFSETRIPVRWPTSAPNLEPREDIWPTDKAPASLFAPSNLLYGTLLHGSAGGRS